MAKAKSKKLVLSEPVEHGSETVTELIYRRPKGGDIRKIPTEPNMGDLIDLAGRLCGREPSFMNELDIIDVMASVEIVSGFLSSGRKTGKKPKG